MSANNPTYTASDVITDVETRLSTSNSASTYFPWISTAYQRLYLAIISVGQQAKEEYFGDLATITMNTSTPNEYTITSSIPRYGGIIKVEVKYGDTNDLYNKANRLQSVYEWDDMSHVTTAYRGKTNPLYYILGPKIGFIPTPPEDGAIAKVWYVKRPYQITLGTDEIDIPYRFTYPITDYVQAKTIQKINEDYSTAQQVENNFRSQIEEIKVMVASEFSENEGNGVRVSTSSPIFDGAF